MQLIDCVGLRFGRLVVIERVKNHGTNAAWRCVCDCGSEKVTIGVRLRNGQCQSCGCLNKETTGNSFRTHGKSHTKTYRLLKDAKKRARKLGVPFQLRMTDITIPTVCPILKIPLVIDNSGTRNNSASLDRIRPERGYVRDNVSVISVRANRLKQDSTIEELQSIIDYIRQQTAEINNAN